MYNSRAFLIPIQEKKFKLGRFVMKFLAQQSILINSIELDKQCVVSIRN